MSPTAPPAAQTQSTPITIRGRLRLLIRAWRLTLDTYGQLHRYPLPSVVERLAAEPDGVRGVSSDRPGEATSVGLLSRAVSRGLRIGPWRPRCLVRSLVLFRLLRAQGHAPVLVIGMKDRASTTRAHAWVELDGRDVGPWPGSAGYRELARYPRSAVAEEPR